MQRERAVLHRLARHCGFAAPRLLHEDAEGWDLRTLVVGDVDPFGIDGRTRSDPAFAHALGEQIGAILAEQHQVPLDGLLGLLPEAPDWPRSVDLPNLPRVVEDAALLARIGRALKAGQALAPESPVLIHGDLGFHNLAFDASAGRFAGIFDYEGAACADPHHDFKYLVQQADGEALLDGALAVYEPATGRTIDRSRVRLLNALSAIGFLAFRFGHDPEEDWCGRTLAEDLAWTDAALTAAGL